MLSPQEALQGFSKRLASLVKREDGRAKKQILALEFPLTDVFENRDYKGKA